MSQRSMIWPRTMTWTSTSLVRMPCASLTKTAICCHLKIRTEPGSGSSQASWIVFLRNWAILSALLYIYIYLPLVWDSWYVPLIWDDDFNRLKMFSHGGKKHQATRESSSGKLRGKFGSFQQLHLISCVSQVGARLHACKFHERAGDRPGFWELNRTET